MHVLIGVALSLVLTRGPPNGFDPTAIFILQDGVQYIVDGSASHRFEAWLAKDKDTEQRVSAVRYFVACAFPKDVVITSGTPPKYTWTGALGLAPSLMATLKTLNKKSKPGVPLALSPDEGKWVSACLMALSNMEDSHQYVLLRGNPKSGLPAPSEAELWTMGYPEGVFFADLLNFNVVPVGRTFAPSETPKPPTKADLEKSYTLSLNLPEGYCSIPSPSWAPPNASNGRVLDYCGVTRGTLQEIGPYRVAQNLGTYTSARFKMVGAGQEAPIYSASLVCVAPDPTGGGALSGHPDPVPAPSPAPLPGPQSAALAPPTAPEIPHQVVGCSSREGEQLRPIFVQSPRVVDLTTATKAVNASLAIQAIDTGDDPLSEHQSQKPPCVPRVSCTGPFQPTSEGEAPVQPTETNARTLKRLGVRQSITVVLRREAMKVADPLATRTDRYTAIVRYRAKGDTIAEVQASGLDGRMHPAGAKWPALPQGTPTGWQWMQVYPVYAAPDPEHSGGKLALKIKIAGTADSASTLELELAGFVSGPPWCLVETGGKFMNVCADDEKIVPLVRR